MPKFKSDSPPKIPIPPVLTIKNADVRWTNFAGAEKMYNEKGQRNFCVFITDEQAAELEKLHWHIKRTKPRDDDEDQVRKPYIQVSVSYKIKKPQITTIGQLTKKRTHMTEETVDLCDYFDVAEWNIMIEPSYWEQPNGSYGIKAYLHKAFMMINEDELDVMMAEIDPEDNQEPGD